MLGRRPRGIVIRKKMPQWRDVDILDYIKDKSGEYDDIEKRIISDPYVDGWNMFERGQAYESIEIDKVGLRTSVYNERLKLMQLGWVRCKERAEAV